MIVLSASDSISTFTGYSGIMREVLTRLATPTGHPQGIPPKHVVFNQGFQWRGAPAPAIITEIGGDGKEYWRILPIRMLPRPDSMYPWDVDVNYLPMTNADVLFTIGDLWYFQPVAQWDWKNLRAKWIGYYEVDGAPIHHGLVPALEKSHYPISASKFGLEAMKEKSDYLRQNARFIWHGVDTTKFKPIPEENKKASRKLLFDLIQRDPMTTEQGKKRLEKLENPFIFGNVARNTERKRVDRLIRAFSIFLENNPDAKRDACLIIHSDFLERLPGTQDIGELRFKFNVQDYVYRSPLMARYYYGCNQTELNTLYNCMDVYTSANSGEGFGVSFIEAGAAGVPSITTNYTCHDSKTKVLTGSGIKSVNEVFEGERIFTLDFSGNVQLRPIRRIIKKHYNGKLIHFKSRKYDLCVTPNHKMLIRLTKRTSDDKHTTVKKLQPTYRSAVDIYQHCEIPVSGFWKGVKIPIFDLSKFGNQTKLHLNSNKVPDKMETNDLLRICGWYIGDGFSYKDKKRPNRGIKLCFVKEEERRMVVDLLKKLQIPYSNERYIGVASALLYDFFVFNFGKYAKYKRIPKWVKELDQEHLHFLLKGLIESDGHIYNTKTGNGSFTTINKHLANDVVEILIKCGYAASIYKSGGRISFIGKRMIINNGAYYVMFSKKQWFTCVPRNVKEVDYSGEVWCLEVDDNHNFFTYRDGKISCSGNSGPELIGDRGWLVDPIDYYYYEHFNIKRAMVDCNKFADAMNESYTKDLYRKNLSNRMMQWTRANCDWDGAIMGQWEKLLEQIQSEMKEEPKQNVS